MNILLVYPHYPDTFWSFRHALNFIGKKASFPPLGLLTVAAMLPGVWDKRLIDLNVRSLTNSDLLWADYVFVSAMDIQRKSAREIIARCICLASILSWAAPCLRVALKISQRWIISCWAKRNARYPGSSTTWKKVRLNGFMWMSRRPIFWTRPHRFGSDRHQELCSHEHSVFARMSL